MSTLDLIPRLRPAGRVRERAGGAPQQHRGVAARHLRRLPRRAGEDEDDPRGRGTTGGRKGGLITLEH